MIAAVVYIQDLKNERMAQQMALSGSAVPLRRRRTRAACRLIWSAEVALL
jgi:hypothetical protein